MSGVTAGAFAGTGDLRTLAAAALGVFAIAGAVSVASSGGDSRVKAPAAVVTRPAAPAGLSDVAPLPVARSATTTRQPARTSHRARRAPRAVAAAPAAVAAEPTPASTPTPTPTSTPAAAPVRTAPAPAPGAPRRAAPAPAAQRGAGFDSTDGFDSSG